VPEGFAVRPDKLANFQTEVGKIAAVYQTIVSQLNEARLTKIDEKPEKMSTLLGVPEVLGPSGPPVDYTNASRAMLTNFDTLLGALHKLHLAVGRQFTYMQTALGETHDLYVQVDDERAGVFQNLLGERVPDGN
jgi:hypothetical protein